MKNVYWYVGHKLKCKVHQQKVVDKGKSLNLI